MTRAKARPADCRIMFDADVAAFLGIDKRTLQRRILRPVPGEIDPNDARPVTIGSRRLWRREDVEDADKRNRCSRAEYLYGGQR